MATLQASSATVDLVKTKGSTPSVSMLPQKEERVASANTSPTSKPAQLNSEASSNQRELVTSSTEDKSVGSSPAQITFVSPLGQKATCNSSVTISETSGRQIAAASSSQQAATAETSTSGQTKKEISSCEGSSAKLNGAESSQKASSTATNGSTKTGNIDSNEVPPPRPAPPVVGKVTHESIELYWDESYKAAQESGAGRRLKVTLQEQCKDRTWGNVYAGYSKRTVISGLDVQTEYKYRLRFCNHAGDGEWSPVTTVSTTKEPLSGEAIHRAIQRQDMEQLELVLSQSDMRNVIDVPDKMGMSSLMVAGSKGYVTAIEMLLKCGADPNFKNSSGKTPLMMASFYGQVEAVQMLVEAGARYEETDLAGSTALHLACDGAKSKLVQWMIDNGANVNQTDHNGWTPLLRTASISGNRDVAYVLLSNGGDINAADKDGKTALTCAIINSNAPLVELLLLRGADPKAKNKMGKCGYDIAVAMDKRLIIRKIEEHIERYK